MRKHRAKPLFLGSLHSRAGMVVYCALVAVWLGAVLFFWVWWLQPAHMLPGLRYWVVTALLGWVSFLQLYFVFFALRAVRSVAPDPTPGAWRVAMIVTKTPSEPFSVLQETLRAMLAQDYPHDTWLADENPTKETRDWCAQHGVKISSRYGVAAYHQSHWPRRTRCKEGNLTYFYDQWGYTNYDIVSQLDADHVPQPGYLREMVRPFIDPAVGYVSAPSICAANQNRHWAVRTRLHTESAFHGILQAGYCNGFAPMCIGSHYAVRTKALKAVGGLGPELAEDHSTTMILNAGGWRGVHAIDAIAIGDGPASIADLAIQEFQWSRSLVTLLLQYTPRYLRALPLRLKVQFLFCQLLYPIFAVTFLAMYLLPVFAVVFDMRYAEVTYPQFIAHALPQIVVLLVISARLRAAKALRPVNAPIISWARMVFVMLQWPWVLWGCLAALRDTITGEFVDFRITPKGAGQKQQLPFKILGVYAVLALGCILPVMIFGQLAQAQGFYVLSLLSGLLYGLTLLTIIVRHYAEEGWQIAAPRILVAHVSTMAMVTVLFGAALTMRSAEGVYALAIGLEPLEIVEVKTRIAGAGSDSRKPFEYAFNLSFTRPETNGSPDPRN
ncbi:cellulose synthase (UDP-forming) [Yoonia tamlensis]|uniref:Cellulose synthase (UDP-forming) n=1 Tax=Yoonia tamlensis TaxID=390270 RepID=A0A1I6GNQ1_9RHOB|nr:glycosyltransferase [Yoonia tamlensis]SFR43756.1 cellulose synthase (UDP-forming) [Yoonia tamlensis]